MAKVDLAKLIDLQKAKGKIQEAQEELEQAKSKVAKLKTDFDTLKEALLEGVPEEERKKLLPFINSIFAEASKTEAKPKQKGKEKAKPELTQEHKDKLMAIVPKVHKIGIALAEARKQSKLPQALFSPTVQALVAEGKLEITEGDKKAGQKGKPKSYIKLKS